MTKPLKLEVCSKCRAVAGRCGWICRYQNKTCDECGTQHKWRCAPDRSEGSTRCTQCRSKHWRRVVRGCWLPEHVDGGEDVTSASRWCSVECRKAWFVRRALMKGA